MTGRWTSQKVELYLNDVIRDENFELNEQNLTLIKLSNEPNFHDDDREVAEKEFWRRIRA